MNVRALVGLALFFCLAGGSAWAVTFPEDGIWWNPGASGRGYVIERQGTVMTVASYHYSSNGRPEWLTMQGDYVAGSDPDGPIGTFSGSVFENSGGQCLGCPYVPPATTVSPQGPVEIVFNDNQHATLTWFNETLPIERTFFGFADALDQLRGIWALSQISAGVSTTQVVRIASASNGNTVTNLGSGATLGSITAGDTSLLLNISSGSLSLPISMPETARFYAGIGSADAVQIIALRLDDTPFAASSGNGTGSSGSTAAVLCPLSQSTLNPTLNITSMSAWTCAGSTRSLTANGIPDHAIGTFPNVNNPNTVSEVPVNFTTTTVPTLAATINSNPRVLGFALNGIKFDPGTAGACPSNITNANQCDLGMGTGQWRIEALGQNTFLFGVDENNAHVQPTGDYHYHGMPEGILSNSGVNANSQRMLLIGWAPDGFPIYARYGYSTASNSSSALKIVQGSYALKTTPDAGRPSTALAPLGAFLQDYQYVAGSGDLDECNGRTGVTPEFPTGTYHYFATDSYPFLPRCWKGTVN